MGKRSAAGELFLGNMGSIQRETRPSMQREDQLTMETKLERIAAKCCESPVEERSAGNPHATFCGSGRRATASRDHPRPGAQGAIPWAYSAPGCVRTQNLAKGRESASQMPRRRSSLCSSRSRSGLPKEYFSRRFARRCVFTQPRPTADVSCLAAS